MWQPKLSGIRLASGRPAALVLDFNSGPRAGAWTFAFGDLRAGQAAWTEFRNLATSCFRRLLSEDSERAAESTCEEAEPVSDAPRCTSPILVETRCVPWAACWTLREISCVA